LFFLRRIISLSFYFTVFCIYYIIVFLAYLFLFIISGAIFDPILALGPPELASILAIILIFIYIFIFIYFFSSKFLILPIFINDYFNYNESLKKSRSFTSSKIIKAKMTLIFFILFIFYYIISLFSTILIYLSIFINQNADFLYQIFTFTHSTYIEDFSKKFFYISSLFSVPLSLLINIMTSIIYVELQSD
jgi:hypothetical protein